MICHELGMDSRTIGKRLRDLDLPTTNLTTGQVFSAVHGDIDSERLQLVREQRIAQQLENAESMRELIKVDDLIPRITQFITAARQRILSNVKLDDEEKDKIILDLQGCVGCLDRNPADHPAPAPQVSRKRVGRAVQVSEPGI